MSASYRCDDCREPIKGERFRVTKYGTAGLGWSQDLCSECAHARPLEQHFRQHAEAPGEFKREDAAMRSHEVVKR